MSTDDPRTLLQDAAAGPVAPLDHDELRRRARGRTRSKWAAAGVAALAAVVGVGGLVANLQAPPAVDIVDSPGGTVAPAEQLPVVRERVPTPLLSYSIASDGGLGVAVDSCGGQPEVRTMEATDEEVRLEVVANTRTDGIRWMCRDTVVVDLERPLGDRAVVDLTTGQKISADEVTASPPTPWEGAERHADGTVDHEGFNTHLQSQPEVAEDPAAVAALLFDVSLDEADVSTDVDAGGATVALTFDTSESDDSVAAVRYEVLLAADGDLWTVQEASWSQSCRDGRGHSEYTAEPCL